MPSEPMHIDYQSNDNTLHLPPPSLQSTGVVQQVAGECLLIITWGSSDVTANKWLSEGSTANSLFQLEQEDSSSQVSTFPTTNQHGSYVDGSEPRLDEYYHNQLVPRECLLIITDGCSTSSMIANKMPPVDSSYNTLENLSDPKVLLSEAKPIPQQSTGGDPTEPSTTKCTDLSSLDWDPIHIEWFGVGDDKKNNHDRSSH
jgi:hypothetical protein